MRPSGGVGGGRVSVVSVVSEEVLGEWISVMDESAPRDPQTAAKPNLAIASACSPKSRKFPR